ncbi:MAG: biopolymer transporter ExbD [Nitrospira sp. SB0678_bin_10]|nr:biopolymer transporter ExbD [Nitrospira sp. SB0662_bin_26]MYF25280.1 biopolymer transporter ExbD [Nitrospira sp. SB0678_bin_10]
MDHELNQINVIPLVDVMLVLLVIVLTTATFISTGQIPVDLAQADATSATPSEPITITITSSGEIFLDGAQLPQEAIFGELQQFSPETLVLVRADRMIQLERFVDVVDDVRGAGLTKISLAVEQQ